MSMWRIVAALAVFWLGSGAVGQVDPRIDESTGRDLANYPPARHFDHVHMRLELDIPDMSRRELTGRQTLTLTPIGRAREQVHLDAVGLSIRGVTLEGRAQPFVYDGHDLIVNLDREIALGETVEVTIDYAGSFKHATGAGLTWTEGNPDRASLTDRSAQIHSQGQTEYNSHWFPCHDSPNEQLTSEMIVTVDSDFQVCSNGRLVSTDPAGDERTRWHWLQDKPHSTYLVVLVVGRFALIGLGGADWDRPELPLTVYAPVGFADRMAEKFGVTGEMIEFFEELLDEPFPWDKYAQLVVREFAAGAMENTSASTFHQGMSLYDDIEDVIAHEVVHQWFGDLVAYKSWEHLWLGEGWATFGEALWAEHAAGEEGREAYHEVIFRNLSMSRVSRTYAPTYPGLASKQYASAEQTFMKADNPYSKGALVLHMLRMRLGDEVFFEGAAEYIDRYKFSAVETDDFRRTLEDVSGQSLERFFRQWVEQPGIPQLRLTMDWEAGRLVIGAEQVQRIDEHNPAYAFVLPFYVEFEDGSGHYVYMPMETREAEASFELERKPSGVTFDPNLRIAAQARVIKPLAMWMHQIEHGRTLAARARAVEAIAALDDVAGQAALARACEREPALAPIAERSAARRLSPVLAGEEAR